MLRNGGILAVLIVGGLIAYRLFGWGSDVAELIQVEQHNKLVSQSNALVDPLTAATQSVDVIHDLLRNAVDMTTENRRGVLGLLEISGGVVSERVSKSRQAVADVALSEDTEAQALLTSADELLTMISGFIPVHNELTAKVLASGDYPPELPAEIDFKLSNLEADMADGVDSFSAAQVAFLE
jgi:hypothetical protein